MNRIILIGNGFDLAHDLPTGYKNFIDSYWTEFATKIYDCGAFRFYEDEFVVFYNGTQKSSVFNTFITPDTELNSYNNLFQLTEKHRKENVSRSIGFIFKNEFWKHISEKPSIDTWLDIEN
ncbi:AbiH family protein, partial [Alistipes sp.]|uniref:AbiH family protein n=1 Tax=Alistipes sp. TaxID=1872444 RepID=UPI003AB38E5A